MTTEFCTPKAPHHPADAILKMPRQMMAVVAAMDDISHEPKLAGCAHDASCSTA